MSDADPCAECGHPWCQQRRRIATLEARIAELERERDRTNSLLHTRIEASCLRCQARADECCAYCGSAPALKLAAARADLDDAVRLLRKVEFIDDTCPVCGCERSHSAECKLDAYLARHPTPDKEPRR